MEAFSKENTKLDEKGSYISQHCLGLPTILRLILENFCTKDLMELSLVNKLWNIEARSVMRERGNVTAKILHGEFQDGHHYQRLSQFASDLANMPVIPFSGIHLNISHELDSCPISCGPLPSYLLDLISWKYFSVDYQDFQNCCKHCPALLLVKQILEDYCGLLEELGLGFGIQVFLGPIFQDRTFPHLKHLTLSGCFPCTSSFVKALVARVPNLQELRVLYPIDLTVNVLERSSAVLVPKYQFCPFSEPIAVKLTGSIRVEEMHIGIARDATIDSELFNTAIPMLLNGSRKKLKTLSMDLFSAVPLMCYGICLENVTTLQLHVNYDSLEEIQPSILALAKSFDFTRVFPRLKQVRIAEDYHHEPEFQFDVVSAFVEQANEIMSRALPERAMNIKVLCLVQIFKTIQDSTLALMAQMFPDIKTVRTETQLKGPSLTDLRKHFLFLEKMIDGALD